MNLRKLVISLCSCVFHPHLPALPLSDADDYSWLCTISKSFTPSKLDVKVHPKFLQAQLVHFFSQQMTGFFKQGNCTKNHKAAGILSKSLNYHCKSHL